MEKISITLVTTEVLDGRKHSPGARVDLPADHPVTVKTAAIAAAADAEAARPAGAKHAG